MDTLFFAGYHRKGEVMTKIQFEDKAFDWFKSLLKTTQITNRELTLCIYAGYDKLGYDGYLQNTPNGYSINLEERKNGIDALRGHLRGLREITVKGYAECSLNATYHECKCSDDKDKIHHRCLYYFTIFTNMFIVGAKERGLSEKMVAYIEKKITNYITDLHAFLTIHNNDFKPHLDQKQRGGITVDMNLENMKKNENKDCSVPALQHLDGVEDKPKEIKIDKLCSLISDFIDYMDIYHQVCCKDQFFQDQTELTETEDLIDNPDLNRYILIRKQEQFLFTSINGEYQAISILESPLEQLIYVIFIESKYFPLVKLEKYTDMREALSHIIDILNSGPDGYMLGLKGNEFTSSSDEGIFTYSFDTEETIGIKFANLLT